MHKRLEWLETCALSENFMLWSIFNIWGTGWKWGSQLRCYTSTLLCSSHLSTRWWSRFSELIKALLKNQRWLTAWKGLNTHKETTKHTTKVGSKPCQKIGWPWIAYQKWPKCWCLPIFFPTSAWTKPPCFTTMADRCATRGVPLSTVDRRRRMLPVTAGSSPL